MAAIDWKLESGQAESVQQLGTVATSWWRLLIGNAGEAGLALVIFSTVATSWWRLLIGNGMALFVISCAARYVATSWWRLLIGNSIALLILLSRNLMSPLLGGGY